ncbi:NAD(P)H-dependent oxidoreductase [Chitinophaga polysaccharea]|uniref:NAD(P)H-dependent oxidoreductase n=1 Tax=Chitinophaga polysaccharea TaxID=1293035 RepID=UPI001455CBAA|nr:NAD(P)H-dependent oxidoreductase [Chitinophaga polysaccharea]NLR59847.1 NAD(P)H-dependent oxidoreductase [Chitinophaga polysaccharea]
MSKILVIVIHPDMEASVVNKKWAAALRQYPDRYRVHDLYAAYPSGEIDIKREQALLEEHETIIFQFPFYWFNCPPLLKKWLDEVLTHGWAYGSKSGYKMKNKKVALAISAGIDEQEYTTGGKYKYTLNELTAPFEITFQYVQADYRPLFAFYGLEHRATTSRIEKSVEMYLAFMDKYRGTAAENARSIAGDR